MSSDSRHDAVTAVLSNIRSLRAYAREVDFEFLRDAVEKIHSVLAEREDEYKEEQRRKQDEVENLEKVKKYMVELGLDPALLTPSSVSPKRSGKNYRPVVPPKYRIKDTDGNTHEWSGRGKPPAAFKAALDAGRNKDDLLIDKAAE
ncbi:H-NS family histone-like protein [Erwinia tasmaniensis]|uniref:Heat-stable nucleoid-structuring protein n=1 Tax=Erwinia tasmaniensis (strain DSM 17950 / CFBP 7177 / CIP 109463 / NCPPB 4357 / Et1/99) TaxID=465817 RepID=B2VAY7_ERWT9|nr:H-NS family nucleoid-associated regulatory protein [Erwinia tasmaniensis]CAO94876.1 Heat-stable nucleoid-structuring protein [Erwinia tasmaniensis Et1/99]